VIRHDHRPTTPEAARQCVASAREQAGIGLAGSVIQGINAARNTATTAVNALPRQVEAIISTCQDEWQQRQE